MIRPNSARTEIPMAWIVTDAMTPQKQKGRRSDLSELYPPDHPWRQFWAPHVQVGEAWTNPQMKFCVKRSEGCNFADVDQELVDAHVINVHSLRVGPDGRPVTKEEEEQIRDEALLAMLKKDVHAEHWILGSRDCHYDDKVRCPFCFCEQVFLATRFFNDDGKTPSKKVRCVGCKKTMIAISMYASRDAYEFGRWVGDYSGFFGSPEWKGAVDYPAWAPLLKKVYGPLTERFWEGRRSTNAKAKQKWEEKNAERKAEEQYAQYAKDQGAAPDTDDKGENGG